LLMTTKEPGLELVGMIFCLGIIALAVNTLSEGCNDY
jgi:hypothetical protein